MNGPRRRRRADDRRVSQDVTAIERPTHRRRAAPPLSPLAAACHVARWLVYITCVSGYGGSDDKRYAGLHRRLRRLLAFDGAVTPLSDADAKALMEADFRADAGTDGRIEKEEFLRAVFQLCDQVDTGRWLSRNHTATRTRVDSQLSHSELPDAEERACGFSGPSTIWFHGRGLS